MTTQTLAGVAGVTYARKIQVAPYETADASFFVQFSTEGLDEAAIVDAARNAFTTAKGVVFEQLGIDMEVNAEGNLVEKRTATQIIKEAFPGTEDVSAPSGNFAGLPDKKPSHIKPSDWDSLVNDGPKSWHDNRPKIADGTFKPNAPHFKAKVGTSAIWLTAPKKGNS